MQFDKETCRWIILGKASEVQRSNERGRVIAALKAAGSPFRPRKSWVRPMSRNAADILLSKMVRDGEIERVERAKYYLSSKANGQNGQKERFDGKATDSLGKNDDLSDLSDLSGRTGKTGVGIS